MGRVAERRKGRPQDEVISLDTLGNGGGRTTAEREAENPDGERGGEALELPEGGLRVQFALDPIDAAGTAAIPGVVENQRRDTVCGQKLLDREPAADGFANAVADEDGCARRTRGRVNKDCVKDVLSAGNGLPGDGLVGDSSARANAEKVQDPVSENEKPDDAGQGKGKGSSVVGHSFLEAGSLQIPCACLHAN
jgi:hypothetical protein